MKRKELYIILGNSQSGKSVTIRGLTGLYNHGECKIETNDGVIDIYVLIRALQEAEITLDNALDELLEKSDGYDKLLIPLHFTSGRRYGTAVEYVRIFINAGFTISQIAALDRNRDALENVQTTLPQLPEIQYIEIPNDIQDMPNNHAAHQIREAWGWL